MTEISFNFDNTYTKLNDYFFSRLKPIPVKNPTIVIFNKVLSKKLGINLYDCNQSELAKYFSGNILPVKSEPISQAYAGHQFGHFTMLGDGRAILIGEHISPYDKRYDIQFKGSGITPYSRTGDGRAALKPMIREYLISEAMFSLNIPTSRSLCVVATGENINREKLLPGAILTRVASSHIRIGTFQYAYLKNDHSLLKELFNYTLRRHYDHINKNNNVVLEFLYEVMIKQIDLVINWMRVGFVHGVMNTDNIALSGETIDYGPCAFMNTYNPKTVFSSIDYMGRYSYLNQSIIMQWNLARFAETLIPLIDENKKKSVNLASEIIEEFDKIYNKKWLSMMKKKLGLFGKFSEDKEIVNGLLILMEKHSADFTNTFAFLKCKDLPKIDFFNNYAFKNWHKKWKERLKKIIEVKMKHMDL